MKKTLLSLIFSSAAVFLPAQTTTWDINSLTNIGGNQVTYTGNPTIKTIEGRQAIEFNPNITSNPTNGAGQRIQVKGNPLGNTPTSFTIEMIFMPYTSNTSIEPRVLHICDKDNAGNASKALTLETRYSGTGNQWYGDFFVKSVNGNGFMVPSQTYPTDKWQHIAMTYDLNTQSLKGYINGELQNFTAIGTFTGFDGISEVSLGGRMNDRNYFKGAIAKVIFNKSVLSPGEFDLAGITSGVKNPKMEGYAFGIAGNEVLFTIPSGENVQIEVYNVMGAKLKTLVSGNQISGDHSVPAEEEDLTAGIYLYKIQTSGGFVNTQKVIVK